MASIVHRLMAFLNSPRGKRLVEQGKRELAKPHNQAKLRRLASRIRRPH